MSDNILAATVVVDRSASGCFGELDGMVSSMSRQMKVLQCQVRKLEEDLARERKIKLGFQVLMKNFEEENKMLKSKLKLKYKKRQEKLVHEANLEKVERACSHIITQCSPDTEEQSRPQTLLLHTANTKNENQLYRGSLASTYPVAPCVNNADPIHQFSQLEIKINALTKTLEETQRKLKEELERSDMMAIQMETYKADFLSERADRENAMGKVEELEREMRMMKDYKWFESHHSHPPAGHVIFHNTRDAFDSEQHIAGGRDPVPTTNRRFYDDILVARGDDHKEKIFQGRTTPGNVKISSNKSAPSPKDKSISSESLNLLSADLGGDDYCK